jgi:short-subunit dehydrogenase
MPAAVIIGASSGIGAALARRLSSQGYTLGLAARRTELLQQLQAELPNPSCIKSLDVSQPDQASGALRELAAETGDVELYIVCAGVGFLNPELEWPRERQTIEVNVLGFAAMVNVALHALEARGSGHIVGISSISALRGARQAPAYNASKAFVSSYLEGVRQRCHHRSLPIAVTDIQPGFVDTPMAQSPTLFWMASAERAAAQIHDAIGRRRRHAYVTRRWRLVAWLLKGLPAVLYERL